MNIKLKITVIMFFVFLLVFIGLMNYKEYENIEELREDYPDLAEEVFSYRKDSLMVWSIRLFLYFLIPFLLVRTGISQRLSERLTFDRGLFMSGLYFGASIFLIIFLINLPLNFYSSFYLRHKYGLTNQTIFRWLDLNIKSFLVNDLSISVILWLPYFLIYRSPKRWWLIMALILAPIIIGLAYISPMLIDPIYNKYEAIEDKDLTDSIASLLEKADIEDANILMVDKSKDTKTMNAYMTGIGSSKRIVFWDTTLKNLDKDEILSIAAHEIGHYVRWHVLKSVILAIIGNFLLLYLLYRSANWVMDNSMGRFGFSNLYNYASLPLFILLLNIFLFLGKPIMNYASRIMEIEADAYEISLTEDRRSAISAMEKLYEQSLGLPRPSKFYKLWYNSHPPLEERIDFYKKHPLNKDYKYFKIPFIEKREGNK